MSSARQIKYNPWGPLPDLNECERALAFTGWAYEGGYDTAEEIYREKFGDLPCFAMEPDGGTLAAMTFLKRAIALIGEGKRIRYPTGGDGHPIISALVEVPSGVQS
ncbi:hypothetical protein SEA_BAZZLE_101 [Mycobacterium phage Bazzle]